jgi:hypothetical protein
MGTRNKNRLSYMGAKPASVVRGAGISVLSNKQGNPRDENNSTFMKSAAEKILSPSGMSNANETPDPFNATVNSFVLSYAKGDFVAQP